jgi:protein-tyrosine phosphatase
LTYLKISVRDEDNQPIHNYFKAAFEFLEKGLQDEKNILVHCAHGRSRSATIIIMFLMKKYQWPLAKVF